MHPISPGMPARRRACMPCQIPPCCAGDWTPQELEQLLAAGAQPVALGDLRLRAETAAVALLAYVRLHLP